MDGFQVLVVGQVLSWDVGRSPLVVRVETGVLWLTRTGDENDFLVEAGRELRLATGHWVIQALESARYCQSKIGFLREVSGVKTALLPVLQRL